MVNALPKKTISGSIYYEKLLAKTRFRPELRLVITCIGHAGNYDSSSATTEIIHKYHPKFLVLSGIAAGIKSKVKIGDVVISQGVWGYESAALESGGRVLPRPDGGRITHSTSQDLSRYLAGSPKATATTVFKRINSGWPTAPAGKEAEYEKHVAAELSIRDAWIASGEKLLRDPDKLHSLREQHGKVEADDMEAIGFWIACQREKIECLVVRGISDFGDDLKDDRFHGLASASAAAVTADYVRRGLLFASEPSVSEPIAVASDASSFSPDPPPGTLRPGLFARSPRLNRTVGALLDAMKQGQRLIALYGRPGDGKTQVGQQLSSLRDGDLYVALPRIEDLADDDCWPNGLRRLASDLLGRASNSSDLETLAATIRNALVRRNDVRLIIDNADAPCPIDLAMLLPHDSLAVCVVIGASDQGIAHSVRLAPPTAQEFREILGENLGSSLVLSRQQEQIVAQIGSAVSYSAIVAVCVGQGCSSEHLSVDLEGYRDALSRPKLTHEDRIQRAIEKCWVSLGHEERERVAIVAALGEAEVPRAWLPQRLAAGSPRGWKLLDVAGVIQRTTEDRVRIHRLIARHAEARSDLRIGNDLISVLADWTDNLDVLDELKLQGTRTSAFLHAVHYLARTGQLGDSLRPDVAAIQKTYIDLVPFRSGAAVVEKHVRLVIPAGYDVASLHSAVLGQLLDTIADGAQHSDALRQLHDEALVVLRRRVAENPLPEHVVADSDWLDASAVHHLGKYLLKKGDSLDARTQGLNLLKAVDRYGSTVKSTSPQYAKWRVRMATARLQLATSQLSTLEESARLLLDVADDPGFTRPVYLRLKIIERLLRLRQVPATLLSHQRRMELLSEGLALCGGTANPDIQAEFLQLVGGEMARSRDVERERSLLNTANSLLARLRPDAPGYGNASAAIGYAVHKSAEPRADPEGFQWLNYALRLYSRAAVNSYHTTRLVAVLRDLGLLKEALELADAAIAKFLPEGPSDYWIEFERAKVLRWAGRHSDAETILRTLLARYSTQTSSITDELAKVMVAVERRKDAADLLGSNIPRYSQAGDRVFSEQCERWLALLDKHQRSFGGLLEDEWRKEQRRLSVGAEILAVADVDARSIASQWLGSLSSKEIGPR